MGVYFRLNYPEAPDSRWPELKARFYDFLVQHHSEWKAIRDNDPLRYLPYMEAQFKKVTGLKLVGLGAYTSWIKPGSYYHWVLAQQGQCCCSQSQKRKAWLTISFHFQDHQGWCQAILQL